MDRPPVDLVFQERRTFEEAKSTCRTQNLWLLVNIQSKPEFASHTLNRDLWSNDTVSEAVMSSFVLWQVNDNTIEGKRISNLYKIDSAPPVVLVIDPVTGQKMGMWSGVIEAQSFVEDLSWFLEAGPHDHIDSLIRNRRPENQTCSASNHTVPSWGDMVDPSLGPGAHWVELPDLTEEPKVDCDESLVCSLCVQFPDGRRKQRRFLKNEPVKLVWSFCCSLVEESDELNAVNAFKMVHDIPGDSKTLHPDQLYGTFEESGLANSIISLLFK
ncbi:hypothetical protein Bca101_062367 [Brassica carinata]